MHWYNEEKKTMTTSASYIEAMLWDDEESSFDAWSLCDERTRIIQLVVRQALSSFSFFLIFNLNIEEKNARIQQETYTILSLFLSSFFFLLDFIY